MKRLISYSELRTRRRCPYKGYLEYDKLLAPKMLRPGLREGRLGDEGLNALYLTLRDTGEYDLSVMVAAMRHEAWTQEEWIKSCISSMEEEWATVDERLELMWELAHRYVEYARDNDPFDEIVCMQLEGRVPVITPSGRASTSYDYIFKLDGLVVIDNRLWVLENKWWKSVDELSQRMLQIDEQCGMYLWGVREMIRRGLPPERVQNAVDKYGSPVGVYYNVVRKKLPAIPQMNKNGETTRRKDIDTTAEIYRQTLKERWQDPSDYADILEILDAKGDTFYYRDSVFYNEEELDEIGRRIYEGTRFIAEDYRYKFPLKNCGWSCPYLPLCQEWSEEVLTHYTTKDRRHEQYTEIEEEQ